MPLSGHSKCCIFIRWWCERWEETVWSYCFSPAAASTWNTECPGYSLAHNSFQKLPKPWLHCFPTVARPGFEHGAFACEPWQVARGEQRMRSEFCTVLAASWRAISAHVALRLHICDFQMLKNVLEELDIIPMAILSQQAIFNWNVALNWSKHSWMWISISWFLCPNTPILIKGKEFIYLWDNKFYAKFQPDGTENSWEIIAPKPGFK